MSKPRLYYLDNLKVFLIILVILHHSGQPYGPTGGFWAFPNRIGDNIEFLGSFFRVNAGFFMGLFFLISGYFLPGSYDRKGVKAFVKDKAVRFGLPILFALFIMVPLVMYFYYSVYSGNQALNFFEYYTQIYFGFAGQPSWFIPVVGFPEMNFGPLWFLEHLLVYSVLYVAVRTLLPKLKAPIFKYAPTFLTLLGIGFIIALFTVIVRDSYDIDTWVSLLGFIQAEIAHLPQYVLLFITGILAYRNDWFGKIGKKTGYTALCIAAIIAGLIYLRAVLPTEVSYFMHDHWDALEPFLAVFMSFGLIVLFREKFNRTSRGLDFMAKNSYAVFVFHFPIVIFIQYLFGQMGLTGVWGSFIGVSLTSIAITYAFSALIRKIPSVKSIL